MIVFSLLDELGGQATPRLELLRSLTDCFALIVETSHALRSRV